MPPPKYLSNVNTLLNALTANLRGVLLGQCELVNLKRQEVLTQFGQDCEHAYFPVDCFVADIFTADHVKAVQVGLTGREGMVNLSRVLGIRLATSTSVVQGAGRAYRIHYLALRTLVDAQPLLRDVLYQHMAVRMHQLAQNLACITSHTVEQRLARWLLIARDCAHTHELALTQETLAFMVGVRRERITAVASAMQKRGLIDYSRGDLTLLDESALRAAACGCYSTHLAAYKCLLSAAGNAAAGFEPLHPG